MKTENENKKIEAPEDAEQSSEDQPRRRYPKLESFALEGPWTEADEIWFECMMGNWDGPRDRDL